MKRSGSYGTAISQRYRGIRKSMNKQTTISEHLRTGLFNSKLQACQARSHQLLRSQRGLTSTQYHSQYNPGYYAPERATQVHVRQWQKRVVG